MIALAVLAVVVGIPVWSMSRYDGPGPVTPLVGVRYLLMCVACLVLSLVAWRDQLPGPLPWTWGLAGALLLTAGLVVVLWAAVRGMGAGDG